MSKIVPENAANKIFRSYPLLFARGGSTFVETCSAGVNARRAMIRVLAVDDHDIVRDALASLLGDVADFQVVGVASSIRDALPLLDSTRPDIVLADLSLGDGSAVELVRALRRGRMKGRVIVITGFSDEFAA